MDAFRAASALVIVVLACVLYHYGRVVSSWSHMPGEEPSGTIILPAVKLPPRVAAGECADDEPRPPAQLTTVGDDPAPDFRELARMARR